MTSLARNGVSRTCVPKQSLGTGKCAVLLVCTLFLGGCWQKAEPEPVFFGQIVPLSGPEKAVGERVRNGLILAVEDANKEENRVLSRRVAVLTPDGGASVDDIRHKAVRLVTVDRAVALLGGAELDQLEALAAVAQSHHVPVVVAGGYVWHSLNDYVFRTALSPRFHGKVLAGIAAGDKLLRLAVLCNAADRLLATTSAVAEAFEADLKKAGGTIVHRLDYKNPDSFKDFCEQLKEKMPQALLFAGPAADLPALTKAGLDTRIPLLFAGEEGPEKLLHPPPAKVVYLAVPWAADTGLPRSTEFAYRYKERFGEPADSHAALAFDNATILFAAVREAKSFEPAKIRKALAETKNFDSLTGPLSFAKDLWAIRPAFAVKIENGQARIIRPFNPEGS